MKTNLIRYKKNIFFSLIYIFMATISSCAQQPKVFGEKPLDLEKFDFNMNIKEFFPDKYIEKISEDSIHVWYDIPIDVDPDLKKTIKLNPNHIGEFEIGIWSYTRWRYWHFGEGDYPVWIGYEQQGGRYWFHSAKFKNYAFNQIDIATTLDHHIMMIDAYNFMGKTKSETMNFLQQLKSEYGDYIKTTVRVFVDCDIYTWDLEDRIIKYCHVPSQDADKISLFEDRLCVISKEYVDFVIKHHCSIYCR